MTECDVCHAKSQLRLCNRCQADLKDNLVNLARRTVTNHLTGEQRPAAGWLELLEDARYGTTRLGESARRSTEKNTPLVVRLGPAKNPDRETQWQDSPLATLRNFHGTLSTWIRHLCESRGAAFQPVKSVPAAFVGPVPSGWRRLPRDYRASITDCAEWLAFHVAAIACDEAAAELYRDVRAVVDAIDRLINRPTPPRFLGPCPTLVGKRQECATRLTADRKATAVTCPACHTQHNVDELVRLMANYVAYEPYTSLELLGSRTSDLPGVLEQLLITVPRSTFHHWRKTGRLQIRGYRTSQGTNMSYRQHPSDEPTYWVADVRRLRGDTSDVA